MLKLKILRRGGDDVADMDGVDGGQNHDLTDPDLIAEHIFGPDGVPEAHDEALQPPAPEPEPHIPDHLPQVPAPPLPAAGAEPKQQRAPAVHGGQRTTPDIYMQTFPADASPFTRSKVRMKLVAAPFLTESVY